MRHLIGLAGLLLSLIGPVAAADAGLHSGSLTWQGLDRTYSVYVPQLAIDQPHRVRRLLVVLHGLGNSGIGIRAETRRGFETFADAHDVIVAYPDGFLAAWTSDLDPDRGIDDVGFLGALADRCAATWNCDADGLLVAGSSNGGLAAYRWARLLPHRTAAIAVVIAQIPDPDQDGATYLRFAQPVPVLSIGGTEDRIFPYTGGEVTIGDASFGTVLGAEASFTLVAEQNGLPGTATSEALPDRVPDGTTVHRLVADGGGPGTAVEHYRIDGGRHVWPDGETTQPVGSDLEACTTIWSFFDRQARPVGPHRRITIASHGPDAWTIEPVAPYVGRDVDRQVFTQLDPRLDHRLSLIPDGDG